MRSGNEVRQVVYVGFLFAYQHIRICTCTGMQRELRATVEVSREGCMGGFLSLHNTARQILWVVIPSQLHKQQSKQTCKLSISTIPIISQTDITGVYKNPNPKKTLVPTKNRQSRKKFWRRA